MPKAIWTIAVCLITLSLFVGKCQQQCCDAPKWHRLTDDINVNGKKYCFRGDEMLVNGVTYPKYAEITFKANYNVLRFRLRLRCGFLVHNTFTPTDPAESIDLAPHSTVFGTKNPFKVAVPGNPPRFAIFQPNNVSGEFAYIVENPELLDELDVHITDNQDNVIVPPSDDNVARPYFYPGIKDIKNLRSLDLPIKDGPFGFSVGETIRIWHGAVMRNDHYFSDTSEACVDVFVFAYRQG